MAVRVDVEMQSQVGTATGSRVHSIITTSANELAATVRNRTPVILHPDDYDQWLTRVDGERPPVELLGPYPADQTKAQKVHVNVGVGVRDVRNNYPELLNSA